MIQDIAPRQLKIEFSGYRPQPDDLVMAYSEGKVMLQDKEEIAFPSCDRFSEEQRASMVYLFSVDEIKFFRCALSKEEALNFEEEGFCFARRQDFRRKGPKYLAFAAVTGCMLDGWYRTNRYCGRCGKELEHDTKERMLRCPCCGQMVYPRINPAVIVGVVWENKLLLTTYKGREYKNYALVAGFVEIGESLEDTVRREVMEEAGLKVKNIRYYGSQPWAFADNLLAGYFCEVDGPCEIKMDEEELASAAFFAPKDIPVEFTDSSLTNEMICAFKNNKY